ncbi:hypothetical protein AXK56_16625 [Tsukamurella pulmonis]|nr:hypothetical protein AXK56_16625 [Tsukamurella pulmonis]
MAVDDDVGSLGKRVGQIRPSREKGVTGHHQSGKTNALCLDTLQEYGPLLPCVLLGSLRIVERVWDQVLRINLPHAVASDCLRGSKASDDAARSADVRSVVGIGVAACEVAISTKAGDGLLLGAHQSLLNTGITYIVSRGRPEVKTFTVRDMHGA